MLPRVYSPETVKVYLKRIKEAQTSELNLNSILDQGTRALISTQSDALCCSTELILFPLLTAVASCMGADATIVVDKAKGWTEKPVLWICIAGRRGDKNSLALTRIKQSVAGLEREMCALHKAQNINIVCDKETDRLPRLLIDEENISIVGAALRIRQTQENKLSLIGMFDNFGTFLRGIDDLNKSPFFNPENLLKLYSPSDDGRQTESSETFHHSIHLNFVGAITAMDLTSLLDVFDADGLSDRLLVTCPKDPGILQTASGVMDDTADSTGTKPTLQMILSSIKNYHQVQKVSYTFREDGRKEFNSCLAELNLLQQSYVNDERRRGSIAKAPGQLARLCAVLTALNNGLEMSSSGGTSQVLPSALMTGDVVKSAYHILVFLVHQKIALMPNSEYLDEEWDDFRVEGNEDSFVESHRTFEMSTRRQRAADDRANGRLTNNNTPNIRRALSSPVQCVARNQTAVNGRSAQASNPDTGARLNNAMSNSFDQEVVYYRSALAKRHHAPVFNEGVPKKHCHENMHSIEIDVQLPLMENKIVLTRENAFHESSSGEVMILTEDNEIASVPDTRRKRGSVLNDRKITTNNRVEMTEVAPSPQSEIPTIFKEAAACSTTYNQSDALPVSPNQTSLETFSQNFPSDNGLDRSLLLHGSFQIKTPAKDISELCDDDLVDYCARKMRKLLLLPGMVVGAATICQKRLFPPVPKEMRVEHPRTTHPVWAAIEYLKRMVKLDLGELVHPVYRFQSIYFRKIRLEYMTPRAKTYLRKLFVTDEEYEQSYPKFDDNYCSSFVPVEDLTTINKTPGKAEIYNDRDATHGINGCKVEPVCFD